MLRVTVAGSAGIDLGQRAGMPSGRDSSPLLWSVAVPLWILAVIGTLLFLRAATQFLIPVVLAVLVSYALEPVVAWLARHRIPRTAGASVILITGLALLGWGAYGLRDDARRAVESLPEAARRAREFVTSASGGGATASVQAAADVLRGSPAASGDTADAPGASAGSAGTGSVTAWLQRGVGSVFALAGHAVVIVFLVMFLLMSGHHFRERLVEVAGPDQRQLMATVIDDINDQIQRFLLVRLVTAVIVGALTWLTLVWLGVQNAAVWGILAGVFNSIPYFGPIIVSGGLLVIGLVQGGSPAQALQMAGAALAITSLEGWLLTPPLMGKVERMSALTVFLGILLWTWVWGAWGTILAVPMLVVVKSVADHVKRLKPVGRLMAP